MQATGAHRRHRAPVQRAESRPRRPLGTLPSMPPAHYEPYLDGLFTYCLSVLCEHDAAAAALGDVLALAERQRGRLRNRELYRPWLYALARWVCLRQLSDGRPVVPAASAEVTAKRRSELAALAWPEAAGTTPEQREALELAVRHQLKPHEVGYATGMEPDIARMLLARAACEVERTRAALAVVELGKCAAVARLAGDTQVLLGTVLRRELVKHVDECPECRVTAERTVAVGPWPGLATTAATAVLAVVEAPRSAAYAALMHAMGAGAGRTRQATPRFDRRGFPADFKDRAARRAQLRNRAVTTTVVAAVVAAPVLAVWAAYRGEPLIGGERADGAFSASDQHGIDGHVYQKAGSAGSAEPGRTTDGGASPRLSVSVTSASPSEATSDTTPTPAPLVSSADAGPVRPERSPGSLTVEAVGRGGATTITLTAGGGAPVRWKASTVAYWLRLSVSSGVLRPGESTTITVAVDRTSEPEGPWTARIDFAPCRAVVTINGAGAPSPSPDPSPSLSPSLSPTPAPSGSDSGQPNPRPSNSPSSG
jgi:hypothetical protein